MRDERYPTSYSTNQASTMPFTWCGRKRCSSKIELLFLLQDDETTYIYPDSVVVVSMDGGDSRKAFCSAYCAHCWLAAYKRD